MKDGNKIIAVRFQTSDAELLKKISNSRGQAVSDFIRLSVRKELARLSFLSAEDKKALGIVRDV